MMAGRSPSTGQLVTIAIAVLGIFVTITVAFYATGDRRLSACEDKIAAADRTSGVVIERLKRIEQKIDIAISYSDRRERHIDKTMEEFERRLRRLESNRDMP